MSELPFSRALSEGEVEDVDLVVSFDDGGPDKSLSVSARRLPSRDEHGLAQVVVIYHDVTADRAQRSALESFAGVVAHDLLGPLGVIDGWAELLAVELEEAEQVRSEDAAPKVARIRTAAGSMQQLIADLLASTTARNQVLQARDLKLGALTRSLVQEHTDASLGVPPVIELGPLPDVHADEAMVRQLLNNLISNAVKYVVAGKTAEILIGGRRLGDRVEVTVADHGIGIPDDQRGEVFEAFHRAHVNSEYAGHGIGLSVCKNIVERHGGRIEALPPLDGLGTRIVFTLPAA